MPKKSIYIKQSLYLESAHIVLCRILSVFPMKIPFKGFVFKYKQKAVEPDLYDVRTINLFFERTMFLPETNGHKKFC